MLLPVKSACSVLCVTCTNIALLKYSSAICPDYMASWFTSVYCILSASFFPLVYSLQDLAVGAPFYSEEGVGGAVYVYHSNDQVS